MQRVMIIGSPGAGKSTLATELTKITGLPLIHLDQLHWKPGWVESGKAEFDDALSTVIAKPRWIIDGNYGRTLPQRLVRADTVIGLDLRAWLCVARALCRVARSHGTVRADMASDCPEQFDLGFLAYIARFPGAGRRRVEASLEHYSGQYIRLRSPAEVGRFLRRIPAPAYSAAAALAPSPRPQQSGSMASRTLFVTRVFEVELGDPALLDELAHSIRTLEIDDRAGKRWSRDKGYKGYTSYASLNDLPRRDPAFADLAKLLSRHAAAFAAELAFDLARKPRLDSLWVNLLKSGGHHSSHFHPHSILSGTLYVEVPEGSGSIRFEDPRSGLMMAAPPRREDAPDALKPFASIAPRPGLLLLWESWLRHEVLPGTAKADRLSISFNFA